MSEKNKYNFEQKKDIVFATPEVVHLEYYSFYKQKCGTIK